MRDLLPAASASGASKSMARGVSGQLLCGGSGGGTGLCARVAAAEAADESALRCSAPEPCALEGGREEISVTSEWFDKLDSTLGLGLKENADADADAAARWPLAYGDELELDAVGDEVDGCGRGERTPANELRIPSAVHVRSGPY